MSPDVPDALQAAPAATSTVRPSAPPGSPVGLLLALSYPLLTHLAVHFRDVVLTCVAALVLVVMLLHRPLGAGRAWAWSIAIAATATVVVLAWTAESHYALLALYLPPVLMYVFMAWVFGRTLVRGSRPLITRIVWHMHDRPAQLPSTLLRYTRSSTLLWAVSLALIAALNAGLALLADPDGVLLLLGVRNPLPVPQLAWSLFANFLSFGLVMALFALEYAYRRRRFPEEHRRYRHLLDFLQQMRRATPGMWRDLTR